MAVHLQIVAVTLGLGLCPGPPLGAFSYCDELGFCLGGSRATLTSSTGWKGAQQTQKIQSCRHHSS